MTPGMARLVMRAYTASRLGRDRRSRSTWWSPTFRDRASLGRLSLDVGLNITCLGYNGSIAFGINTTPQIAPGVDELADSFEPALRELEQAAGIAAES